MPSRHRRMIDFAGRHQAEQRPGRLRRRARRRLVTRVVELVARAVLAPAAVGVLDRFSQATALLQRRIGMIDPGGVERAEHRPGAVDVIDAPAAEPAAVRFLLFQQVIDACASCGLFSRVWPSCASIETQRAVTSAVGGSSRAP